MAQVLATLAVVLATILAGLSLIPQILKLVRTRDAAGVSATWPAIGLVTNGAWCAYLIQAGLWPFDLDVLMVVFYGVVMWLARAEDRSELSPQRCGQRRWGDHPRRRVAGSGDGPGVLPVPQVAPAIFTAYRTSVPLGSRRHVVDRRRWALWGTTGGSTATPRS